jgi:hypothetical protein
MKIIEDIPGRRLRLTGEGTTLPSEARWVVMAGASPLVLLPAGTLWYVGSRRSIDPEHVLYALVWLAVTILIFYKIWMEIRRFPALFEVDRESGKAHLGHAAFFGGELDDEVLGLDTVTRVTVSRLVPPDADAAKGGSKLTIGFHADAWPGGPVHTSAMTFAVDGLDRSEEVVDFAFRIAAAAGLPSQRIVRNDPRAVEVELSRGTPAAAPTAVAAPTPVAARMAVAPVPDVLPAVDFTRDEAAPAARAAATQEVVEAFRPATFVGDHDVTVWNPGVEVVFYSSWDGWMWLFGLPFLFVPVFWYWWQDRVGELQYSDLLSQTVVAAVIGLVIGIPSLVGVFKSKSWMARLDWAERTISIRDGSHTQVIPMADVTAVELDCHHQMHGGSGAGVGVDTDTVVIHTYDCEVRLHWRDASGAPASATLIETFPNSEADVPYRRALPLVTELARALGVERRVTDYDVRRPAVAVAS